MNPLPSKSIRRRTSRRVGKVRQGRVPQTESRASVCMRNTSRRLHTTDFFLLSGGRREGRPYCRGFFFFPEIIILKVCVCVCVLLMGPTLLPKEQRSSAAARVSPCHKRGDGSRVLVLMCARARVRKCACVCTIVWSGVTFEHRLCVSLQIFSCERTQSCP